MGEVAQRFLQMGFESVKGTAVNATRIVQARITNPAFNQPREFVEEDRGTLVAAQRFISGVRDYGFTIETDGATYEDLGQFLATVLKGGVAASTVNTTGKQYIYTPQTTATGDDLKAATIEFGDDTQEFECTYCEGNTLTLGFDTLTPGSAAPLRMSVDYLAKSLASNTKTASLSLPTVETILATGATLQLGDTSTAFAALPTVSSSMRSFTLTLNNNLGRKVFVGDGTNFSNIGRGRRVITFETTFEGDATGVTRFVEWDLATEKRMRLSFAGTTITGSSPAAAKALIIDGRFVLTSFDPVGSVDTNTVFACSGRFLPDSTISDSDIRVTLTNDVASYT